MMKKVACWQWRWRSKEGSSAGRSRLEWFLCIQDGAQLREDYFHFRFRCTRPACAWADGDPLSGCAWNEVSRPGATAARNWERQPPACGLQVRPLHWTLWFLVPMILITVLWCSSWQSPEKNNFRNTVYNSRFHVTNTYVR